MRKGKQTREQILDEAVSVASQVGLESLTIGDLAKRLALSKSGLFAHFQSKERLQIAVVEAAAAMFTDRVVRPAVREPRGLPRVRAIFDRWMHWSSGLGLPGGCLFVGASSEFDDRPGAVRDAIADKQKLWIGTLERAARIAVDEGHFRPDLDPTQFAFDVYSAMLGAHLYHRLLDDADARQRAARSFERVLADAQP